MPKRITGVAGILMLTVASAAVCMTPALAQMVNSPLECEPYARDKANSKSSGAVGGSVAGAITGVAVGHVAKGSLKARQVGAAAGAIVGGTAGKSDWEARYQKYYHGCLNNVFYN